MDNKENLVENEAVETENKAKKVNAKQLAKENEELKAQVETLKKESLSYKESWVRTAADFDNFRKRNQETRINAYKEGKFDIVSKLLVIGDNLESALLMNLDEKTKEGVKMIARQFKETLEAEGFVEINPVGEVFDPNTQEAVMKVPASEGEVEGTVKQVFKKGYKCGEKVIRYAQVVVIG